MRTKANVSLAFVQADNIDEPPKLESQKTAGYRSLAQDSGLFLVLIAGRA